METEFYLAMLIVLGILALTDLMVGVSNDAVNFLNAALGSKAASFKTIMIVASIGIAFGALSSSGMMEVARKGIFNPSEFVFAELMVIFMAVMITDVLLLDFFNSWGMPTSTTVSIVFEILGAAVAVALLKILDTGDGFGTLGNYINISKATIIILVIFLSIGIAFAVGAVVQFISRLLLSFRFEKQSKGVIAIFGGMAITAIVYFIIVKRLKSAGFFGGAVMDFAAVEPGLFLLVNVGIWTLVSWILMRFFKQDIYRIIIMLGTFALAMAFAGNDLVNFIGVPLAALYAFQDWQDSGVAASNYGMESLATEVPTPVSLLLASAAVMILTLWFSNKARYVTKTEINLARSGEGEERFPPNFISRYIVTLFLRVLNTVNAMLPWGIRNRISQRFARPGINPLQNTAAFDKVRASVNLMVASVLIALATSMTLPLSTTYVTFMVAMGTALADRAWGAGSAVYRVAGVLNVIGGWIFTALCAFFSAAILACLIHLGGVVVMVLFLLITTMVLIKHNRGFFQTIRR